MRTLIVIPTYNEIENIVNRSIASGDRHRVPERLEILVVDDGSPDGTGRLRR